MSADAGISPYLAKLDARRPLPEAARKAFLALPLRREEFSANQDILVEGEATHRTCYLQEGFVSRNKSLPDGARQIVSFHLPGDMVDLQSVLLTISDHGISTHVRSVILTLAHGDVLRLAYEFPALGQALWFDTLVDASIFREWTLNVGRRPAVQRLAHLLLELHYRYEAVGLADNGSFELPVTQTDLADALGLSAVHTNRSIQQLRRERLVRTFRGTLTIENMPALIELARFDPLYLHPEGPREVAGIAVG